MTDGVFKIEMAYGAKSVPKSSEDIAFILGTLGYTNMGFIKVDDYFGHGSGAPVQIFENGNYSAVALDVLDGRSEKSNLKLFVKSI